MMVFQQNTTYINVLTMKVADYISHIILKLLMISFFNLHK